MRTVPVFLVAALLLAACGGASAPHRSATPSPRTPAPATSKPAVPAASGGLTKVSLLLDWYVVGFYAPMYVAISKGYYKHAGLDVTISPGKGSVTTAQQVGAGQYDLGFADASASALAISKGVPIKVVAVYFQKSPLAVISPKAHPIAKPADLIGKRIGATPGSTSGALLTALMAANHVPAKQVQVVNMSGSALVSALESGKVDGLVGFNAFEVPPLVAHGFPVEQMLYANYGITSLSEGLIANNGFLKNHAGVVKAFVQATTRGWDYARQHPAKAVAILKSMHPKGADLTDGVAMMKMVLPLLRTPETAGHPLGWMSPTLWNKTLGVLTKYEGLKSQLPPTAYYTDRYTQ